MAIPNNTSCMVQISSLTCCIAGTHNTTCTVQIEIHQFYHAIPNNRISTVQIVSQRYYTAIEHNLRAGNVFNRICSAVFFPWRYTTHSGCVFYSPLSGFSLLAYEVTWSHTATRHIR